MPEKVSLRRGDRKKKAPKYKNSFAFKHNKNSRYTKKIANIDTKSGTCRKCRDIIEWRKKYRKYKPVKDPKTW